MGRYARPQREKHEKVKKVKEGNLVFALGQPKDIKLDENQMKSLGLVKKINLREVIVQWPNVGDVTFRYVDLRSIDP